VLPAVIGHRLVAREAAGQSAVLVTALLRSVPVP
jgi:hypothetical protein